MLSVDFLIGTPNNVFIIGCLCPQQQACRAVLCSIKYAVSDEQTKKFMFLKYRSMAHQGGYLGELTFTEPHRCIYAFCDREDLVSCAPIVLTRHHNGARNTFCTVCERRCVRRRFTMAYPAESPVSASRSHRYACCPRRKYVND